MSKERDLLVRCRVAINIRYDQVMLIRLHHEIETLLGEVEELLDQPEKNLLIEKCVTFLRSLIENNGEGLKELQAFDLETYNKLKEVFGNE